MTHSILKPMICREKVNELEFQLVTNIQYIKNYALLAYH